MLMTKSLFQSFGMYLLPSPCPWMYYVLCSPYYIHIMNSEVVNTWDVNRFMRDANAMPDGQIFLQKFCRVVASLRFLIGFWVPELRPALHDQGENLSSSLSKLFPGNKEHCFLHFPPGDLSLWGIMSEKHMNGLQLLLLVFLPQCRKEAVCENRMFSLSSSGK